MSAGLRWPVILPHSHPKKKQGKNKKDSHTSKKSEPLRVLTINFQSIKNKKPEVELIIESCKPSIIFGTETWLSNDISKTLFSEIPSCSNDSPLSDGGR
jgi:hypothetical protein